MMQEQRAAESLSVGGVDAGIFKQGGDLLDAIQT